MPAPVIVLPTRLEELVDSVSLTNPADGDVLTFDTGFWKNLPPATGGGGGVTQAYVDSRDALRVLKTGDVMTGPLTVPAITLGALGGILKATAGVVAGGATTTDLPEGGNLYFTNARADGRITAQKAVANGLATLGADSKIPSSQLPAIALQNTSVVASEVAMLALVAETGDVAVRTDLNKSFILAGADPTNLADWQELLTPTDAVLSVNGQTGIVALTTTDVAEGANEYFTQARARAAFSATAPIQLSGAGVISIPQADATHDGFLSQIDWSAFNSKQNALGFTPADVAGDTFSGNVGVANQGELQLFELASNGGNFFGLMAPANLAANRHLVFPSADPVNGQLLSALAPDGSGNIVTSWIDPAAGGGGGLTNAFAVIKNAAGVTQFSAAGADALSLDATGNVAINFDATNKRVTFSGTGDWPQATNALALGGVGAAGYSLVGHIHPVTALTGGADGQFVGHVGGVPAWANLSVSGPITLNSYQIGFSRTRMVIVDQGGKGDFTTITGAVTYVAGQTRDANNIWVIEVHPGVYTEAPFTIPTFTALVALTVQAQNGNGVESKIVANASLTAGAFISMDSGSSIIGFIVSADAAVGATADTYVISTTAPTTGIVLRGQNLVIQGSNAGTTFLHSGVGGNYQLNNVVFSLSGANEVACVRHNGNFPVMTNCVFSSVVKYGVYVSAGSGTLRMINCGFDGDTPVNSGGEVFASGAGKVRAINTNVRTIAGTNATTVLSYEDRRPTTRGKIRPSAVDQTPFTLDGMSGQTAPIGLFTLNGVETVRIDEQGRFQHSVANLFRNSGFTVGLQAPTLAANGPVFKLPAADGVAKSCVVTDGAGNLSMGRKTRRAVFGLTDAATIATDVSVADVFTVTLGGNRTLGAPTNAVDGDEREWWIKQDSTGGRTLTFDTGAGGFAFSTDLPSASVVPSAAANSISGFKAKYLSLAGKWLVTGKLGGF